MGQSTFVVHNEVGDHAVAAFTTAWMPAADRRFAHHLGTSNQEPVHVILSSASTHAVRFPPSTDELIRVLDPGEASEARKDPAAAAARYSRRAYALGIATRITRAHRPPVGAIEGELGIYIDVESITEFAAEFRVDATSLLAVVLVHELAHCRRDHADIVRASPTHDWLKEGDAQRDTWQVLTDMLPDDACAAVAYEARAAQLRLAHEQPAAYKQFAVAAAERAALGASVAVPERHTWIVRPARAVFRLVRDVNAEVAVFAPPDSDAPRVADRVYLCDDEMLAGPWTLVAIEEQPRVGRRPDVWAARHGWRSAVWWQLRTGPHLVGTTATAAEYELKELMPVRVDRVPAAWQSGGDAMQVATSLAELAAENQRGEIRAQFGEDALSNPRIKQYLESFDPWDD